MSSIKTVLCVFVLLHPPFITAQTQLQFPGPPGTQPVRMILQPNGNAIFVGTSPAPYSGIVLWSVGAATFSSGPKPGGSRTDTPQDATVDSNGNIWIVGNTNSDDFQLVNPIITANPSPGRNMGFVMELDPTGTTVKFASYLGGHGTGTYCDDFCLTSATAITADTAGNVYVGGSTDESDFPVTPGAWLTTGPNDEGGFLINDMFYSYVAKISAAGKLVWATFIGTGAVTCEGGSSCVASDGTSGGVDALTVDSTGAVTAAESLSGENDALVRLAPDASKVVWTTPVGQSGDLSSHLSLAPGTSGNIAVFGEFAPLNTTGHSLTTGTPSLFVAEANSSGSILYQTDIGGASPDASNAGISLDSEGNMWLSGTDSSPTGALAGAANAGADFVLELNSSGNPVGPPVRFPRGAVGAGAGVTSQSQVLIPGANGALLTLQSGFSTQIPAIVGFTNAASFTANTGIYQGALVSLFGFGLPATTPQITIGGFPATVLYAGANQINIQVPFEPFQPTVQIALPSGNLTFQVPVSRALGIFTVDGTYAAALNQDGTVNSASNPAAKGSIVTFYGTGAVWPAGTADGGVPTAAAQLDQESNGFQFIDSRGIPQFIQYAGAAPEIIDGVFQLNVTIPADAQQPFTLQSVPAYGSPMSSNVVRIYTQ